MSMFDNASVAKPNEGGNFTPMEEGTYPAVCHALIDLGTHTSSYNGEVAEKHQLMIGWEIPSEQVEVDGKMVSRTMYRKYNITVGDGGIKLYTTSRIYKDLVSWRGKDFTEEEKAKFGLTSIVGAPCMIQVTHSKSPDGSRTYANVNGIMKLMKGIPAPQLTLDKMVYTIGGDSILDVAKLPEWIGNIIKESPEYKAAVDEYYKNNGAAENFVPGTPHVGAAAPAPAPSAPTTSQNNMMSGNPDNTDDDLPF